MRCSTYVNFERGKKTKIGDNIRETKKHANCSFVYDCTYRKKYAIYTNNITIAATSYVIKLYSQRRDILYTKYRMEWDPTLQPTPLQPKRSRCVDVTERIQQVRPLIGNIYSEKLMSLFLLIKWSWGSANIRHFNETAPKHQENPEVDKKSTQAKCNKYRKM